MNVILRFLLSGVAVLLTGYILPGVHVDHFGYALLVAAVLSIVNVLIKPVLIIFTIPITIVTMGIFLLVINALIIMLVDAITPGFLVDGFWWALAFSLILSVLNSLFNDILKDKKVD